MIWYWILVTDLESFRKESYLPSIVNDSDHIIVGYTLWNHAHVHYFNDSDLIDLSNNGRIGHHVCDFTKYIDFDSKGQGHYDGISHYDNGGLL